MLRKLEKYEILEEIGHGGMATVYRAHDTVLDRPVALKVMHPHLRAAEEARRRFHREARSVARLRHPRVLEIYDFSGEGSDEAYIAAELLTGPTLKQWREQREEVPAEIAACFAIEIGKALEAAHAANIVHRDVKPENVLLHEDREIKLTDFGIADMIDAQSMTATGQILGSPGHMAPEQIEGKDCDARTDLFSLGTVLYYLATGRLPFTGRNPHQVLKRIVDGEYADPLRVSPTIGGRLRAIIVKALERDPDVRYQSAREMVEELEAFLAEAGIEDSAQMLERYLKDPEKVGAEVRAQVIDRLIDRGARASDAGDVPAALDYYNRVLALDEGNERVLKLIERVGMDRRRRAILTAAAGLTVLGAVAAAGAWALWPEPRVEDPRPVVGPIEAPSSDAGADAGAEDAAAANAELDAGPPDSGSTDVAVAPDAGDRGAPRVRPVQPPSSEPRLVRFVVPSGIMSVNIAVGGETPQPFHAAPTRTLRPGPHDVTVVAPASLGTTYRSTRQRIVVRARGPDDPEEQQVPLRIDFSPGALYVVCTNVADAEVTVLPLGGGAPRVRGSAGALLAVPIAQGPTEVLMLRVTAPGYRPHQRTVELTPGGNTVERTVTLDPEPAPEP